MKTNFGHFNELKRAQQVPKAKPIDVVIGAVGAVAAVVLALMAVCDAARLLGALQ